MDHKKLEEVLTLVLEFLKSQDQALAVGLCGSWARGTANPNSDIDLSIISLNKEFFKSSSWLEKIDFKKIDERVLRFEDRKYGRVWSRHIFLSSGAEIEFSFADRSWTNIKPVDPGTKKVVSDGYRILYDPDQILWKLIKEVNGIP